jgi:cell wall assembly regulator SMI1
MVVPEVEASWPVIRHWLARVSPGAFAPGAAVPDEVTVRTLERALGRALPPEFPTWWRCVAELADGPERVSLLPPRFVPLSPQDALDRREMKLTAWNDAVSEVWPAPDSLQEWDREPAGSPQHIAWLPSWLPIAEDNMGGVLFADLRDGPLRGAVRSFFHGSGASEWVIWAGLRSMLAAVATGVTTGAPVDGCLVRVDERGRVFWDPQ